jgi:hypothetical protein
MFIDNKIATDYKTALKLSQKSLIRNPNYE